MSLFIDALAKRIIRYMKYQDEEIKTLKSQLNDLEYLLNRGEQVCNGNHLDRYDYIVCDGCGFKLCDFCYDDMQKNEKWIFMSCGDEIVEDPNGPRDHYKLCSSICFERYYGEPPVLGQFYFKRK